MMKTALFSALLLLSAVAAAQDDADTTSADDIDILDTDAEVTKDGWPRLNVSLGYLWLDASGTFDVILPNGRNVRIIDFDRLGIDDKDGTWAATVKWRSRSSRWGAWFGYWSFNGAGVRVWEDELDIDGIRVPVGAAVATDLSTDWYILEATYSFLQNERWDAGVGFGFHVVDLQTRLAAAARIGDEQDGRVFGEIDTLAPLPNLLGYASWRIGDRWDFTARYGWFGLSYDEYDGQMTNLNAVLRYRLTDRWFIDGGYQFVKLDVDVEEKNFETSYDLDFKGPSLSLQFNF